ncbi:hypothetical protein RhiirA4_415438 [Rhizophagus irregularis]|uniref:Uncharacterized protein n=1 Tax=Rhizophagus irregularis TaxID=588596 RepID=A0A2I1FZW3_9GLOM|nr:hypothetical protein RhiirA4_415438 [Rhizophagus irregularis]
MASQPSSKSKNSPSSQSKSSPSSQSKNSPSSQSKNSPSSQSKNNNVSHQSYNKVKPNQTSSKLNTDYEQKYSELKVQFDGISKQLEEKNSKIQDLEQKIQDLEQKNSKLHYALEAATDVRLLDDDENHSTILKKDILDLQYSLEDYTKCKGKVNIDIPAVQKLLTGYGSKTVITEQNKPLIQAVLQRHVIEQINGYAKHYFKNPENYNKNIDGTETYVIKTAKELTELTQYLTKHRIGDDDDSVKVLPIILRQKICAALGNRGFNDMVDHKSQIFPHRFIIQVHDNLNKEIDKYRKIIDPKKSEGVEGMAGDIIKKFITLFYFRFKVQEPIADYIWFNHNREIDPSYMEGNWDDEEIDNNNVDFCYFPLIAQEFKNESKRHIYTLAKIVQKSINSTENNSH